MEKPDLDQIEAFAGDLHRTRRRLAHPRSPGDRTEIYDYLRLLYASVGLPHCPSCGRAIAQQTAADRGSILELPEPRA